MPKRNSFVMASKEICYEFSEKYYGQDTLCITSLERENRDKGKGRAKKKERNVGRGKGREKEAEKEEEEENDENRDTILALFPQPHPLYDSKKKVAFSIGPSTTSSSRTPSLAGDRSSRPSSLAENQPEKPLSDDRLLYPIPEPRFDYPIGDMIVNDMSRFEKHFKIKPPNSDNWIFYSGEEIRYEEFARFKNAAIPTFNAKHFGDMYPKDVIRTHLMKYLRKEKQWKASAMSLYRFACMAKGHVHLLLHRDCKEPLHPYPDGVDGPVDLYWELFEMWALTRMGRVKKITRYNADDFSEVGTLWQIGQPVLGEPPDFWISPCPFKTDSEIDHDLYSSALWT
jgi:hypothetical protein